VLITDAEREKLGDNLDAFDAAAKPAAAMGIIFSAAMATLWP